MARSVWWNSHSAFLRKLWVIQSRTPTLVKITGDKTRGPDCFWISRLPWDTVTDVRFWHVSAVDGEKWKTEWFCIVSGKENPFRPRAFPFPSPLWNGFDKQAEEAWPETRGCLIICAPLSFCQNWAKQKSVHIKNDFWYWESENQLSAANAL